MLGRRSTATNRCHRSSGRKVNNKNIIYILGQCHKGKLATRAIAVDELQGELEGLEEEEEDEDEDADDDEQASKPRSILSIK